jgi:hypothetical protein
MFFAMMQVSDVIPKVPRLTVDERIQQTLALDAPQATPALEGTPHLPFPKDWQPGDRTLSGLDMETSKRMPLPPIPCTPPRTVPMTPRMQAWVDSQRERTKASLGKEEEEKRKRKEEEEEAANAFFMTQVGMRTRAGKSLSLCRQLITGFHSISG